MSTPVTQVTIISMKAHLGTRILYKLPHTAFFLSVLCLLTTLCFLFPEALTTPEIRRELPLPLIRTIFKTVIWSSILMAVVGMFTSRAARLSLVSLALQLVVLFFGGSDVPVKEDFTDAPVQLGLDWFVLDLLLLAVIFVPLESLFPQRKHQKVLRPELKVDLTYFLIGHLGIQALALLTQSPAHVWFRALQDLLFWQEWVFTRPLVVQIFLALFVADFVQYWIHRGFHESPRLWRFHRAHHSIKTLDWLAGSRLHLVDIVVVRALVYFSILLLGVSTPAFIGYLAVMAFHTVLIHSNLGFDLRFLEKLIVTPRYHHWHHHDRPIAYDKNYAVHFPWIDRIFGTHYLPEDASWPEEYGVDEINYPRSYWKQFLFPFRRQK